jgi:hypothetical protein
VVAVGCLDSETLGGARPDVRGSCPMRVAEAIEAIEVIEASEAIEAGWDGVSDERRRSKSRVG